MTNPLSCASTSRSLNAVPERNAPKADIDLFCKRLVYQLIPSAYFRNSATTIPKRYYDDFYREVSTRFKRLDRGLIPVYFSLALNKLSLLKEKHPELTFYFEARKRIDINTAITANLQANSSLDTTKFASKLNRTLYIFNGTNLEEEKFIKMRSEFIQAFIIPPHEKLLPGQPEFQLINFIVIHLREIPTINLKKIALRIFKECCEPEAMSNIEKSERGKLSTLYQFLMFLGWNYPINLKPLFIECLKMHLSSRNPDIPYEQYLELAIEAKELIYGFNYFIINDNLYKHGNELWSPNSTLYSHEHLIHLAKNSPCRFPSSPSNLFFNYLYKTWWYTCREKSPIYNRLIEYEVIKMFTSEKLSMLSYKDFWDIMRQRHTKEFPSYPFNEPYAYRCFRGAKRIFKKSS